MIKRFFAMLTVVALVFALNGCNTSKHKNNNASVSSEANSPLADSLVSGASSKTKEFDHTSSFYEFFGFDHEHDYYQVGIDKKGNIIERDGIIMDGQYQSKKAKVAFDITNDWPALDEDRFYKTDEVHSCSFLSHGTNQNELFTILFTNCKNGANFDKTKKWTLDMYINDAKETFQNKGLTLKTVKKNTTKIAEIEYLCATLYCEETNVTYSLNVNVVGNTNYVNAVLIMVGSEDTTKIENTLKSIRTLK